MYLQEEQPYSQLRHKLHAHWPCARFWLCLCLPCHVVVLCAYGIIGPARFRADEETLKYYENGGCEGNAICLFLTNLTACVVVCLVAAFNLGGSPRTENVMIGVLGTISILVASKYLFVYCRRAGGPRNMETDIELAEGGAGVHFFYLGGAAAASEKKKCRQGHDLTPHITEGGSGTCDGCLNPVAHGTQVVQCFQCVFFLCRSCALMTDASETTAAERQAADKQLLAAEQRQAAMAAMRGRQARKAASLINAAAAEEKEQQVRVKWMLVHVKKEEAKPFE